MRRAAGTRSNGGKFRTTAFKPTMSSEQMIWSSGNGLTPKSNLKRSKQELPF
jgi:hypothetical protein